ncbi:MAG: sodium:proton antiporter [Pseudomonadota bacterium]
MNFFSVIAILLTAAALFSFLNHRYLHLPRAIGIMLIALLISIVIMLSDVLGFAAGWRLRELLADINFSQTLLQGMLSFMLFAGALQTNYLDLKKEKYVVGTLATVGVIISTFIIGVGTHFIMRLLGIELSLLYCLAFGALISPTDPIAVLAVLKHANIPKSVSTEIAGEALFNDGMGVVAFFIFMTLATAHAHLASSEIALILIRTVIGGILIGIVLGWIGAWLTSSANDVQVEALITLALAAGGYALAMWLKTSAPIAVVVAGLWLGHKRRLYDPESRQPGQLAFFWELIDEILNALLFVLIGFYLLMLPLEPHELTVGGLAIVVVLLGRYISVGAIVAFFRLRRPVTPKVVSMLTWGGIRGGISIALALSIPVDQPREIIVSITYIVVAFSILVQGLTIRKLIKEKQ